jgi:hypothetical protein
MSSAVGECACPCGRHSRARRRGSSVLTPTCLRASQRGWRTRGERFRLTMSADVLLESAAQSLMSHDDRSATNPLLP